MKDYWQYKTVHYWANVVRNKQAFCMNADFFKTAEVVLPREVGIAKIWEVIPPETLHWMQTRTEPYERQLDLQGDYAMIWLNLWNHTPIRETIREVLLTAARNWLAVAERGGIGPSVGPVLSPRQEAEICVRKGLLNPPDPILLPEAVEEFYKLATTVQEYAGR